MLTVACFAVLYLVEALIAWLYFEYLFSRKKTALSAVGLFIVGYLLLFLIYQLGITAINTISFFLVNAFFAKYIYSCTKNMALIHSAFLSFVMTIAEIIIALLITTFGYEFDAYTYDFSVMIVLMVMSKLLYLIFSIIGSRLFSPHKHNVDDTKMMAVFCILPVFSMLISVLIVYLGSAAELTKATEIMIVINVSALLIVNLLFMLLYNHLQKTNLENLELQLSIQKDEADASYYQLLKERSNSQQILIHDIRNHLQIIEGLAKENEVPQIISYISHLDSTFCETKPFRICSDPIINLIISHFYSECQAKHIDLQCDIRGMLSPFMDAPCTTALLGNLLANALESAECSEDKEIEFTVLYNEKQGIVLVSVKNSCDTEPNKDSKGRYVTKKNNAEIHGIGLKSIERIVKKYAGVSMLHYDNSSKQFHHVIQFPINKKSELSK